MDFTTVLTTSGNGISLQTYFDKGNITFNRIEIGSEININPKESTALANKQIVGRFLGIEKNEDNETAIIKFTFDNKEVTNKFEFLEYGIWATYTTDSGDQTDCLYAYGYSNSGKGTEIPAFTGSKSYFKEKLNVSLKIGSTDNVSVYLGEYEDYVNKESFEEHINNQNNPHNVTAEDIGLGNVENVSASDAVINIDEETINADNTESIKSGEKVSVWWAKVKNSLEKFKKHLSDYKNPHNVTLEQLTGVTSLPELLKKIITEGSQHIELRNNRYLKGQSTDGKSHALIGVGSDNNIFIGNDEASYLHLHAKNNFCLRIASSSNDYKYWSINNKGVLYPSMSYNDSSQQNNDSGLGTSSRRVGAIYTSKSLNTSDAKLKENITDAEIGLEILKRLSVVQFNFINEKEVLCGVIAQEVFTLFQELGIKNSGVYQASVAGNDPNIHPELENLTDDEILKCDDSKITWNVDYNSLTYYCIAGFQKYIYDVDKKLAQIEKEIIKWKN